MTRRELLRLGGSTLLFAGLAPLSEAAAKSTNPRKRRLFFTTADLPHIRANARTPLLKPMYDQWAAAPISGIAQAFDKFEASGDIVRDYMAAINELIHCALVHLVDPSGEREEAILSGVERIIARPYWDYFRDGGTEVIGIQRASYTTVRLLIIREILDNAISAELDKRLMKAVAEKGCQPCFATVYDMEHPETVQGWDFDEHHMGFYDIDMVRWPMILGANNLRAAPTGALGLGALALQGIDPRAEKWLKAAVDSTNRFLKLISPDGSYFEGLSYLDYSLRTTLPFLRAHQSLIGDIDWFKKVNWDGVLDYIMTMQFGKTADGSPDIVNFSDARGSIFPGAISMIGEETGNALAGFAAQYAGNPRWCYDFFWYRPDAPVKAPGPELLNKLNDLNWIICRSGWEENDSIVAFKSGGPANHEHADRNHIMLKAYGERLLNDHFGAAYDRRDEGWKMRFTRAHNAVLIDGRGHPYVDGIDGTNDSKAYANVTQYEDHGEHVWWTSDATSSYILDNYHAHQILRTVLFAKPDVLVVMDQVRFRYRPQTVDARFYPDNADSKADIRIKGKQFTLSRPKAQLHGLVESDTSARPRKAKLEVSEEVGDFPCVEVHADEALTHHIVTALVATKGAHSPTPRIKIKQKDNLWSIETSGLKAQIRTTIREPQITIL